MVTLQVTNAEKAAIREIAERLVVVNHKARNAYGKGAATLIGAMVEIEERFQALGGDTMLVQQQGTVFQTAYQGALCGAHCVTEEERVQWVMEMVAHDLRYGIVAVK